MEAKVAAEASFLTPAETGEATTEEAAMAVAAERMAADFAAKMAEEAKVAGDAAPAAAEEAPSLMVRPPSPYAAADH
jgi:hypothetical protein